MLLDEPHDEHYDDRRRYYEHYDEHDLDFYDYLVSTWYRRAQQRHLRKDLHFFCELSWLRRVFWGQY